MKREPDLDSQMQHGGPDPDDTPSSPDTNPTFAEVAASRLTRRSVLGGGLGAAALFLTSRSAALAGEGGVPAGGTPLTTAPGVSPVSGTTFAGSGTIGFESIPLSDADEIVVPPGYSAAVLIPWGTPIHPGAPAWDLANTAADQARQVGMGHDGMHFFPIDGASDRGLLVLNHEYTIDRQLFPDGTANWDAEKTAKSQAAHGVSVVEVARGDDGTWDLVLDSPYNRRITATTPMAVSGPAAGHDLLKTSYDPTGTALLGTANNCSMGPTPWGTYLTCEENANGYFHRNGRETGPQRKRLDRYGYSETGFGYLWATTDDRFDTGQEPNEPNRFHWIVEVDPFAPGSTPVKRTALGRFKHESAQVTESHDHRVVVYSGDDERFDHVYKFVGARPWRDYDRARGESPLDDGVLHVAVFHEDGTGSWVPLTREDPRLRRFRDQGELLVETRVAADLVGATRMDRPEWVAVHPDSGEVYLALTNNTRREEGDAANPVAPNPDGHVIRWREAGGDAAATSFAWDIFLYAGPTPYDPDGEQDIDPTGFGSPDGLWFDPDGRLWIQTDGGQPEGANDQMLAADPRTGDLRRFLTGVPECEVTGVTTTPDQRTFFVNIQHPGDDGGSDWPDKVGGTPRPATVVITKDDGGVIGT